MELNKLTIKEAGALLQTKKISAVELTKACLEQIKKLDGDIKACLTVCEKEALAAATAADVRLAAGETGALLGIPCLIKDNMMTAGIRTTAASKMLENYVAPYNATVISRLKDAGAVILAKTNMDEFAHGASTETSAFQITKNPYDLSRVPGGSSGGSAAGVAADMCIFALGSDTGGSIRQPASFCGIFGLKTSYGRVSRHGLMSMTSSTDTIGPLTKTAEDAALVLQVIAGPDNFDSTANSSTPENYLAKISDSVKGLKIGLPKEYFPETLNSEVRALIMAQVEILRAAGAEIVDVSLPYTKYGVPVYYIITPCEISSNLARLDGLRYGYFDKSAVNLAEIYAKNRGGGFGAEAKRRIMVGTYALSAGYYDAYYKKANKVRMMIARDFTKVFSEVDILLTPTTPTPAFKIGEKIDDPITMYLEDIFVSGPSLAGLPAISVPAGKINNLPLGLQLIGQKMGEAELLRVANFLDKK